MKTIRNWYSEQRKLTAFLREHKDEYYPLAKPYAIRYALVCAGFCIITLSAVGVSMTYTSVFLAFWVGTFFGTTFALGFWLIGWIVGEAKNIISHLKKKHHYNTNR